MKKIVNYIVPAICLVAIVFSVAAFNKVEAATAFNRADAAVQAGQPVDGFLGRQGQELSDA